MKSVRVRRDKRVGDSIHDRVERLIHCTTQRDVVHRMRRVPARTGVRVRGAYADVCFRERGFEVEFLFYFPANQS